MYTYMPFKRPLLSFKRHHSINWGLLHKQKFYYHVDKKLCQPVRIHIIPQNINENNKLQYCFYIVL